MKIPKSRRQKTNKFQLKTLEKNHRKGAKAQWLIY